jgi:uncharacterized protein
MKLVTRDLLVELLLEAFDEPIPADAVRARMATLVEQFPSEQAEITEKLSRYIVALEEWRVAPQCAARETALRKATLLFNHHLFFEVHEVLEAQWRIERDPLRLFFQGLIQVAVAFHHLERRNFRGAVSLLHDGLEKIMPYRPSFLGVELQEFVTRLLACDQELQHLGPEHCDQFQAAQIPRLQYLR